MALAPSSLFFPAALTASGWQRDVLVTIANGRIAAIEPDASPPADAVRHDGVALPGIANLHSHAFQRGMAGLAERGGRRDDLFWSWREVMYRFVAALSPDDVGIITTLAFMEMLEAGFTRVGEFHYLHNDIDGRPYAAPAELAVRVADAAAETGIGLTLLPVFYAHGGFGGAEPEMETGQRRFINSLDGFARLLEDSRTAIAGLPGARFGIAPHSLRAVTPDELVALLPLAGDGPIHIHAAEQEREVAESVATLRARPVEFLLDRVGIDARWCLIHSTHMTEAERTGLARSGAVAGLCPVTEGNLGDGIFALPAYLAEGGKLGIGTDSNVAISLAHELRQLEYSQRLRDRARNLAASPTESSGTRLFTLAAAGAAQAVGEGSGMLEPGGPADIVVLDAAHPALAGRDAGDLLDSWVFASGDSAIADVYVGGRHLVHGGKHIARDAILGAWRGAARRLADAV